MFCASASARRLEAIAAKRCGRDGSLFSSCGMNATGGKPYVRRTLKRTWSSLVVRGGARRRRAHDCAKHGLRYDPDVSDGCVLCRRAPPAPAEATGLTRRLLVAAAIVAIVAVAGVSAVRWFSANSTTTPPARIAGRFEHVAMTTRHPLSSMLEVQRRVGWPDYPRRCKVVYENPVR